MKNSRGQTADPLERTYSSILLLLLLFSFAQSSYAQTYSLATKGRSADLASHSIDTADRFGEHPAMYPMDKVERFQHDSIPHVILTHQLSSSFPHSYRVDNHPQFNTDSVDLKELKKLFPSVKHWVGFDEVNETESDENGTYISAPFSNEPPTSLMIIIGFVLMLTMSIKKRRRVSF